MRHGTPSWRHEVPIEMRFIDLFMAAFGALVFMTMLLVIVGSRMPSDAGSTGAPPKPAAAGLRLLTKDLAPARMGVAYSFPLAVRGGTGALAWELTAGTPPDGTKFDTSEGVIQGTPTREEASRFVVRVRDASGGSAEAGYELVVGARGDSTGRFTATLPYLLIALLGLLWLSAVSSVRDIDRQIAHIDRARREGHSFAVFTRRGIEERVSVIEGRETKLGERHFNKQFGRVTGFLLLLGIAWLVYRHVTS